MGADLSMWQSTWGGGWGVVGLVARGSLVTCGCGSGRLGRS